MSNETTETKPLTVGIGTSDLFGVWIPVAERLPETGNRVLVAALNGIHGWITVAQYWPAGTMDASDWDDPPDDWWDDDHEKCTNPEPGWYEAQIEAEVNYQLHGVSHWMTLPPLPSPNIPQSATPGGHSPASPCGPSPGVAL